jgi:hypothetical protein
MNLFLAYDWCKMKMLPESEFYRTEEEMIKLGFKLYFEINSFGFAAFGILTFLQEKMKRIVKVDKNTQ